MIISKMKFSFVGDLFFPKRCASCGKLIEVGSDCLFCTECAHSMVKDSLVDERYPFRRVVSAYVYIDGAAHVVRNMKHEYIPKVVDFAANEVLNVITANTDGRFDVVTFVPRYGKHVPYSSSKEMAKRISKSLGVPFGEKTIIKTRNIKSQTSCRSDKERRRNVSNAFSVGEDVRGKRVLVIDDVQTTGSTLREVGRVLAESGAEPFGAVFARVRLAHKSKKFVPVGKTAETISFKPDREIPFSAFDRDIARLRRKRRQRRFRIKTIEKFKKKIRRRF